MKLPPHRNESGHPGYPDLAAENTDEVHESGERGSLGNARQGARFQRLENDTTHQADVGAREPYGQQQLDHLEAASRPRRVEVRKDPAADRDDGEPNP